MKSRVTCLALLLFLWGCGSSKSGSSGISISISPTSVTLTISATQQFTATVHNTSNTGVVWQVNSVTGGNTQFGQISTSGLYTAPPSLPPSGSVTITAVSAADSGETATATATVALPIVVTPSSASVEATMTQQFTATVSFSSNKAVNWQVNGGGGNSTVGTISSSGLYTAPNVPPTPNSVTITAVAQADNTHAASAVVTVTPPPIVISPTNAVVAAGAQQSFTATILSNTVHPAWAVTCRNTAPGACGSIGSDGTFTAPLAPPPGALVTISASMPDGSGATESVTATIQFANATLNGRYVITLADGVGHSAPSQVGTLACDGSGHITGGVIDGTDAPGVPVSVTGGTYTVGTDGRGTATVQTSAATLQFQFVLSSNVQGYLVRTDSGANQAAGTIDLQQNTSGTTTLNGAYALALSGVTTGATPVLFGEAGSILLSNTGAITGGVTDVETNLALQTGTVTGGSYTQPSSNGRGTLTFTTTSGTATLAYYAIDNTRVKLINIDGSTTAAGELVLQPQGPFSNASFKGPYAFSVSGLKNGSFFGVIGVFSPDGSGTIKNQQFDGIPQTAFDFNPGGYAVTDPQSGRTTATWTANGGSKLQYILYPRNDGGFVILENDGVFGGTGVAIPQVNPTELNVLSLGGALALSLQGSELSTPSTGESITGHFAVSDSSSLSGTIDNVKFGQGVAFGLNLTSLNFAPQRYAFGITTTAFTGGPLILYRIDDNRAFSIDSDGSRILVGIMQRQF